MAVGQRESRLKVTATTKRKCVCEECREWTREERQQQRLHCIPAGELSITFGPAGTSQICFWQRGELNLVAAYTITGTTTTHSTSLPLSLSFALPPPFPPCLLYTIHIAGRRSMTNALALAQGQGQGQGQRRGVGVGVKGSVTAPVASRIAGVTFDFAGRRRH